MTIEISTWQEFAAELIASKEIDPSYNMLVNARAHFGDEWVKRYCVGYLLFYHTGVASDIASASDFWAEVERDFDSKPRGTERRHFRGEKARAAVRDYKRWMPSGEIMFDYPREANSYPDFHRKIKTYLPQFGDYFIWKWHDFAMCVFEDDRSMSGFERLLPAPPRKALNQMWPTLKMEPALKLVTKQIQRTRNPFVGWRPCGPSEAETIACSFKGYVLASRPTYIGFDIKEKHGQLFNTTHEQVLREMLPPIVPPNRYKVIQDAVLESARLSAEGC